MFEFNSSPEDYARCARELAEKNSRRSHQLQRSLRAIKNAPDPRQELVEKAVAGSTTAKFNLIALFGAASAAQMIKNYKPAKKNTNDDETNQCNDNDDKRHQDENFEFEEEL